MSAQIPGPQTAGPEEKAISDLYRKLLDAWNMCDAAGYAVLFEEDGRAIGFDGSQHEGRAGIEADIGHIFADHQTAAYLAKIRMDNDLIAKASISIYAPVARVWEALVSPDMIKQYMFGTNVVTDWEEGSVITWQGEWQGKAYEDKGIILRIEPKRVLQYSHFSPLSGRLDVPENYHTVTIELSGEEGQTTVALTQDNNESEEARQHSEDNWQRMLESLKKLLEDQA